MRALVVGSEAIDRPGGVESVCRGWVDVLGSVGFDVRYLAAAEELERARPPGLPLYRYWRSGAAVVATRRAASRYPAEIVITNGPIGWGVRGSRASFHMYHGTYREQAKSLGDGISRRGQLKLGWFDGGVLERAAGRSKRCLANSGSTASEVDRWYGYACEVIWPPIDVNSFSPGPGDRKVPQFSGAPTDRPRGLFVGSGRPTKGERIAYEVMRRTPHVDWMILGDAPLVRVPDGVRHGGMVDPGLMPDLYRTIDFLLVTSPYESFGMVIAEALACGTPVVAGPSGAADLLLKENIANWRVPTSRDPRAFASVIERHLLDLPSARTSALQHGRSRVVNQLSLPVWRRSVAIMIRDVLKAN